MIYSIPNIKYESLVTISIIYFYVSDKRYSLNMCHHINRYIHCCRHKCKKYGILIRNKIFFNLILYYNTISICIPPQHLRIQSINGAPDINLSLSIKSHPHLFISFLADKISVLSVNKFKMYSTQSKFLSYIL